MTRTFVEPAVVPGRAPVTTLAILLSVVTFHLFVSMHTSVPDPYMDEIFHIKQAQTYCDGNFTEWDPKLTTLPGLYFISLAEWKVVSFFVKMKEPCSIWNLRLTNFFFSVAGVFLFHRILSLIHLKNQNMTKWHLLMSTLNLVTFPLLYFFTFLYYTDQASTFFVFSMLYFHLLRKKKLAALLGAVAVFTRQTNIVWVGCLAVLELFQTYQLIMANVVRKEDLKKLTADKDLQILLAPFLSLQRVPTRANLRRISGFFLGVLVEGLPRIWGYLSVLAGFLVFLFFNKGIVVGDRSAHEASFHVAQIFYFSTFTLLFAAPFLITAGKVKKFLLDCCQNPFRVLFSILFIFLAIDKFTYVHPYLLADNRHFTFYIWNRVFQRHFLMKFALAPIYFFAIWTIFQEIRQRGFFRVALFFTATFAVLVPQRLLEFRYFILPFLLFRIQLQKFNFVQLILEFLLFQTINALTLYLFVNKPFKWASSPELQHFMW